MKTARFLAKQMRRLYQAGIRDFIIRGNHDALTKITKDWCCRIGSKKLVLHGN